MNRGTVVYIGNFELPDHGASANRVVGNGKLFQMLGFRTVFLGVKREEAFSGIRSIGSDMYEEAYPQKTWQWFRHMVSVRSIRTLAEKYQNPEIIILYNAPFALLCSAKKAFPNAKVVYDCTEWSDTTDGSAIKRAVKKADERYIRTRIDGVADGLIVVSTLMQRTYQNDHILLLPPLVDADEPLWHQSTEKKDDRFEFCFSGMLDGKKDSLDLIVRAFVGLDDVETVLRIIGVDKEAFTENYPELGALVRTLDGRLIFMGRQTHAETLRYIQNADCNLIIRQADRRNTAGFPTKFTEAYTAGKPIITTDISDVKRYADRGKHIYVVSHDEADIQKAMKKVIMLSGSGTGIRRDFHYASFAEPCEAWLSELIPLRFSSC